MLMSSASGESGRRDGRQIQAAELAILRAELGERAIRADEPLARHGTFGVGGPAEVWVTIAREEDLARLVTLAAAQGWPLMLVGNGTNILYADAGARGVVARMADAFWRLEATDRADANGQPLTRLIAGAGVSLPRLVNDLAERGLSGLEWGAGVPGTVGGGVVSNAGAHGACIGDTLESVRLLTPPAQPGDEASFRSLPADALDLRFRHSRFRAARRTIFDDDGRPTAAPRAPIEPPEMIVGATFLLWPDEPARIQARVAEYKRHRKETQPPQPSAGSVFINPPGDSAGRLIEAAGLKGSRVGRAQISPRHANFIVNTGGALAADVVGLIALARRTVRERLGVELELEVELRGDW